MTYDEFTNYDLFSYTWNYKLRYLGYSWKYINTRKEEVFKHYIYSHGKIFIVEVVIKDKQIKKIQSSQMFRYLIHKKYNTSHTYCKDLNYMLNTDKFNYSIEDFYELLIGKHTGDVYDNNASFRVEYFVRKMQQAWTSNYEFVDFINQSLKSARG